jgi:hypothetical protein
MCVYTHTGTQTHTTYTNMHKRTHTHTHTHTHVCMYVCMYLYTHAYTHTCTRIASSAHGICIATKISSSLFTTASSPATAADGAGKSGNEDIKRLVRAVFLVGALALEGAKVLFVRESVCMRTAQYLAPQLPTCSPDALLMNVCVCVCVCVYAVGCRSQSVSATRSRRC